MRPLFHSLTALEALRAAWRPDWSRRALLVACVAAAVAAGWLVPGCREFRRDPWAGWWVDMPTFRMVELRWVLIEHQPQMDVICPPGRQACAARELPGYCVIFSTLTENQARVTLAADGLTVWVHEVDGHCGGGTGPGRNHP